MRLLLIGGDWNMTFIFPFVLGLSSSQLTFIFLRGVAQPPTRLISFKAERRTSRSFEKSIRHLSSRRESRIRGAPSTGPKSALDPPGATWDRACDILLWGIREDVLVLGPLCMAPGEKTWFHHSFAMVSLQKGTFQAYEPSQSLQLWERMVTEA